MPADIAHVALKPWLALLYVALFSQWIGFFAWNAGMAIGGIARVSQVQLLQPFFTFALAALFDGETITLADPAVRVGRGRDGGDLDPHPQGRPLLFRQNSSKSRLSSRLPDRSSRGERPSTRLESCPI